MERRKQLKKGVKIGVMTYLKFIKINKHKKQIILIECPFCQKQFKSVLGDVKKLKSCGCLRNVEKRLSIKIGTTFNSGITLIKTPFMKKGKSYGLFKCHCGKEWETYLSQIKNNIIISCGCSKAQTTSKLFFKHGDSNSKSKHHYLYVLWGNIKNRCYNTTYIKYFMWGGRGIKVYSNWIDNYIEFKTWVLANLGEKPIGMSLDRFPNNESGNYEPGNLRWATPKMQANNTRRNKEILKENILKILE